MRIVRAGMALAAGLVYLGGCHQVEPLPPGGGATPFVQAKTSPAAGATSSTPSVAAAPDGPQVVKAYRIPDDPAGDTCPSACDSLPETAAPADCHVAGLGSFQRSVACAECQNLPAEFGNSTRGLDDLAAPPDDGTNSPMVSDQANDRSFQARCRRIMTSTRDDVFHDYVNYYSRETLVEFVVILAPAAVFANSDWDADVATWYQNHVRSNDTNRAASFFRPLGNGWYTIPAYVSAKLVGEYFDDVPGMGLLGEFGDRTTRALLVGGPPLLALQYATGGGRPSIYADESYWRPFHGSHGASGHAFMGAVPFLTLAGMTDDPFAKCFFYACSPWTGATRINDNLHYLSQVWLGWWMAWLSCHAVNNTEAAKGPVTITPLCTPEMNGIGLIYEH